MAPSNAIKSRTLWAACLTWGIAAPACSDYDLHQGTDADVYVDTGLGEADPDPDPEEPGATPDIRVTPQAIDYGLVPVGSASSEPVTITNEGDDVLWIDEVAMADGAELGFSVEVLDALPLRLLPGEGIEAVATFTPIDGDEATGIVEVYSDDPDEPTVPVDLSNDIWLQCDDRYAENLVWKRSELWYSSDQLTDSSGTPWFSPWFDDSGWSVVSIPEHAYGTSDHDVFYRTEFMLHEVAGTTEFEFEGNDGVWLYVNGHFVGHWGGEWREGGCINDPTGECGINYEAPPVDVTSFLQEGRNTVAVMLTNGPSGYYLDIRPTCVA